MKVAKNLPASAKVQRHRSADYPWQSWLTPDGNWRQLTIGSPEDVAAGKADISARVDSFLRAARSAADLLGVHVESARIDERTIAIRGVVRTVPTPAKVVRKSAGNRRKSFR